MWHTYILFHYTDVCVRHVPCSISCNRSYSTKYVGQKTFQLHQDSFDPTRCRGRGGKKIRHLFLLALVVGKIKAIILHVYKYRNL